MAFQSGDALRTSPSGTSMGSASTSRDGCGSLRRHSTIWLVAVEMPNRPNSEADLLGALVLGPQ